MEQTRTPEINTKEEDDTTETDSGDNAAQQNTATEEKKIAPLRNTICGVSVRRAKSTIESRREAILSSVPQALVPRREGWTRFILTTIFPLGLLAWAFNRHYEITLSVLAILLAVVLLQFGTAGKGAVKYLYRVLRREKRKRRFGRKPNRIILIRHGQSQGNVDHHIFKITPDNKVDLTELGREQARAAGVDLRKIVQDETMRFFVSPYQRSYSTFMHIVEGGGFSPDKYTVREEPRLREQDWGNFQDPERVSNCMLERRQFGSFYYRFPQGESGADVYDRVTDFLGSLQREFKFEHCLENFVLVSHGITLRVFMMRYFKWTVEEYHKLWNLDNCQIVVMELQPDGHYKLMSELKRNEHT